MSRETRSLIRIFLASPEDCAGDREKAEEMIQELNGTVARSRGLVLESYTWKDIVPDMGRPEQVILDQIQMAKMDIFVGFMWQRFGTPTGEIYDSGTEEEFFQAYNTWCSKKLPRILFYFCTKPSYLRTSEERNQFESVMNFKSEVAKRGMYKEYPTSDELIRIFRQDLTNLLDNWSKPVVRLGSNSKAVQGEGWDVWLDAFGPERNRNQRVEVHLYKQANFEVKFMTISGRSIYCTDVEEVIKSRNPDVFKFKLLLFDWNSPCFAEKMRDERRRTSDDIEMAREKAQSIAKLFLRLGKNTRMDLQVRLYKEYPVWRFMVLDEMIAYVGYYPPNKRGYEGPMFSFRKTDPLGLFYPFNQYFDKLWKVSSKLDIEDLK